MITYKTHITCQNTHHSSKHTSLAKHTSFTKHNTFRTNTTHFTQTHHFSSNALAAATLWLHQRFDTCAWSSSSFSTIMNVQWVLHCAHSIARWLWDALPSDILCACVRVCLSFTLSVIAALFLALVIFDVLSCSFFLSFSLSLCLSLVFSHVLTHTHTLSLSSSLTCSLYLSSKTHTCAGTWTWLCGCLS